MKRILNIQWIGIVLPILILSACIKDKGNYDIASNDEVSIKFIYQSLPAAVGDTVRYKPELTFKNPQDSPYFEHAWYVGGQLYSKTHELKYYVNTSAIIIPIKYFLTDTRTGALYTPEQYMNLTITSPFAGGWGILYEDHEGKSEIAHTNYSYVTAGYITYTGMYKKINNEDLGSRPFKIFPYSTRALNYGVFVTQKGGQGAIDINGKDFKKMLVASNSFTKGVPESFEPIDYASFNNAELVLNKNGDIYARFLSSNVPFTFPWFSTPVTVEKGMKIKEIWNTWHKTSYIAILFDELNKRLLYADGWTTSPGGGIEIKPIPAPANGYPANFTSLQNFGNWEYIWGDSFQEDVSRSLTGGILLRSPIDHKIYFQSFDFKLNGLTLTPKTKISFLGSDLVDEHSLYESIKTRNYIFFTAAGNKDLYYFDIQTGTTIKLYEKFNSKIMCIAADHTSATLGVGLENGDAIIYDISQPVLSSGQSKEIHRIKNLGKIIDMQFKSTKR